MKAPLCAKIARRGAFLFGPVYLDPGTTMNQLSEIGLVPPQFADTDIFKETDLRRRVVACLKTRLPGLEGIEVTVMGNTVIIRGELLSAEEKWRCGECCRHVPGVMRVMDKLVVSTRPLSSRC